MKHGIVHDKHLSGMPDGLSKALGVVIRALEQTPINDAASIMNDVENKVKAKLMRSKIPRINYSTFLDQSIRTNFSKIQSNDRIDLLVRLTIDDTDYSIAIEFDAARADQVAKKFVSRSALLQKENLIYIAYCYPGTKSMSLPEVIKYFGYMKIISESLKLTGFIGMAPPKPS
jgi:hypothetical protein